MPKIRPPRRLATALRRGLWRAAYALGVEAFLMMKLASRPYWVSAAATEKKAKYAPS